MEDKEKIDEKPKIGLMLKGQAWVELDGIFNSEELRSVANQIDKNCEGLEKKDVN